MGLLRKVQWLEWPRMLDAGARRNYAVASVTGNVSEFFRASRQLGNYWSDDWGRGPILRITIREVAREAGVSVTAASRALNNKGEMRPEKRALVLAAAHRLQYTPSSVARALVSGKSKTLGVLVTNTSPVYADILHGIEEAAHAADYGLLFANSTNSQDQALRCLTLLRTRQVDGVLLTSVQTDRRDIELLQQAGIPFVLLLRHFPDLDADYVVLDNVKSGYLVTEHLLELGHRRIGHVAGPLYVSSAQGRLAGYRKALRKYGARYVAELVEIAPFTIDGGYTAALALLDRRDRPSAIVAATDLQAVGVLKAARTLGLRIPDDLALTGGDDIELAEFLEVPLTTFHQPARQIGSRAAGILIARLNGEARPTQQLVLKPRLIVRRSSGGKV
jgi:DNA-binding LacI/PurR family transcriptional regulator